MKLFILCLSFFLAPALTLASRDSKSKTHGSRVEQQQSDVDQLFLGLDGIISQGRSFIWIDDNYYRSEGKDAGKVFFEMWNRGDFLDKTSPFTLFNHKNRRDTFKLFEVFFFANNFNTFFEIAKWAKYEINSEQFVYVLMAAIMHRQDMDHIRLPRLYEVLPHYFIPPEIIQGVNKAVILGQKDRSYDVNNTGHEFSWYKGLVMESYKSAPQWNKYDTLTRMTYYSEDVMLADYMVKAVIAFAPWIYAEKFYRIPRKGEQIYHIYKHMLSRYNLERYANNLPPVRPLDFTTYIKTGYNPHVGSIDGRPFTTRPDYFVPQQTYPQGVQRLIVTKRRYDDVSDLLSYINPMNESYVEIEDDFRGLNRLGELVFGSSHPQIRSFYKPYQYQLIETLDAAVADSRYYGVEASIFSNFLTEVRDPLYYRVLATVNEIFQNYFSKLPPYTLNELTFPGVKITDFKIGSLETFFEKHMFEITNIVPAKHREHYHYSAFKHRLQHKAFMFNMTVNSDQGGKVAARIYITPRLDASNRPLSVAEQLQAAVPYYYTQLTLKKGSHTYPADSDRGFYSVPSSSKFSDYSPKKERCMFPRNLILPRGGKPFTMFVILSPVHSSSDWAWNACGWNFLNGVNQFVDFPTDKKFHLTDLEQMDNMFIKNITIKHKDYYYDM